MLTKLLRDKGIKPAYVADKLGYSRSRMSKLLKRESVTVEDLVRVCQVVGVRPGDLLPNSGAVRPDLASIVDKLTACGKKEIEAFEAILSSVSTLMQQKYAEPVFPTASAGHIHTRPKWSDEFPLEPEDFIETDFDFPLELHAVEVEELEAAAGSVGVGPNPEEQDMGAYVLSMRDVRDASHRVVKVRGDSMAPVLMDGWKVLVDTKKRFPRMGDLIAVYLQHEGSLIGYWEPRSDGNYIVKANKAYPPIKLPSDEGMLWIIGVIQKIVDAPLFRRQQG